MKKIMLLISAVIIIMTLSAESMIRLKVKEFNTDLSVPEFETEALNKETMSGTEDYFLVQFSERVRPHHKEQLISMGAEFIDYIPDNAFIVKMDEETFIQAKNSSFVKFIQLWQPGYKIEPHLLNNTIKPLDIETDNMISLLILAFNEDDTDDIISLLENSEIRKYSVQDKYIKLDVSPDYAKQLAVRLAGLSEVYWIERQYPFVLHNTWSRWISDSYDTTGMRDASGGWISKLTLSSADDSTKMTIYANGVFGDGQIVGVDDTGLDWDNIYFRDNSQPIYYDRDGDIYCETPNYSHRKVVAYNTYVDTFDNNSSGHGTHTSGSVAGDSLGSSHPGDLNIAKGSGMAPNAKISFFDMEDSDGYFYAPSNLSYIYEWQYDAGARITSSSWGYPSGGSSAYTSYSAQLDQIMWNNKDLLMFRSAGNSNNDSPADSVNAPATAKNIVTVGASESGFGSGSSSWSSIGTTSRNGLENVAEFSSHGPTKEGQMKPELIAPGGWYIWSADSDGDLSTDNTGITYMGGTSMSCPTAAGYAALVRDYFESGYYPSGQANAADSMNPSGALVKAIMINSTRNSPGRYSTDQLADNGSKNAPSMGQGWGRITLDDALYFDGDIRDIFVYDETSGFNSSGDFNEYIFTTDSSLEQYIKIVLTYTDYPAGPPVSSVVVNDLDLSVSVEGNTYKGNVFGTEARSVTGGSYDSENVTEVIWLDAVPNSQIIVRVDANTINFGPQPFALAISGDIRNEGEINGIVYNDHIVIDTISGNTIVSDSSINNGETADIKIWIKNKWDSTATSITGELLFTSTYASIDDSILNFPDIVSGDSADAVFTMSITDDCPDGKYIPFTLISHYNSDRMDTSYFSVKVKGTSIIGIDRDSLLIETDIATKTVKTAETHLTDAGSSKELKYIDFLKPVKSKAVINKPDEKAGDLDTLMYDDGTASADYYSVNRFAVKFAPDRACSIKTIYWHRYTNYTTYDTLFVNSNNSGIPGSILFSESARLRGTGIANYFSLGINGPVVKDSFFISVYAHTSASGTDTSYMNADSSGGDYSYYYNGSTWINFADNGWDNDLMIRAVVKYLSPVVDSGMFHLINNYTESVKDIELDSILSKNNSSWIERVEPQTGTVLQNDSLGIQVYIDTTGLLPDTVYRDTLEIYTDADMSKAVMLELPVVLRTTQSSGIETPQMPSVGSLPLENSLSVDNRLSRRPVISYSLSSAGMVKIDVFDVSGRLIDNIVNADKPAGRHNAVWDKRGITGMSPSGVFFIRARIGSDIMQERIIYIK